MSVLNKILESKWLRWAAFLLGLAACFLGGAFGLDWLVAIGLFLTGWALPYIRDVKVMNGIKAMLKALDKVPNEAKPVEVQPEVKKLAGLLKHKPEPKPAPDKPGFHGL
jgi:hypothetical protein